MTAVLSTMFQDRRRWEVGACGKGSVTESRDDSTRSRRKAAVVILMGEELDEQEDTDGKEEKMIKKGNKRHRINATHRAGHSLLHTLCAVQAR